eukprot:COSAG01_NODE_16686_length_1215_cov_0.904122_2_plen_152_part_00
MPSDRDKLATTTKIREAKGLTPESYVPTSYLGNTMTILKASSKFKRNAKERRKRLLEEQAERELEQAGSIWTQQRRLEEEAAAGTSAQQTVVSQGQQQTFVPAVQATDNTKLEDQIGHLTAQVSQLHTMMKDLVDRESRRAESGGLAFRMP